MRRKLLLGLAIAMAAAPAAAQPSPRQGGTSPAVEAVAAPPIVDMDVVVVSGVQPGPGLWKFHKGDRVLWILGTLSPLPKDITWLSRDMDAAIAQSQLALQPPRLSVSADIGLFGRLSLLPSMLKLRKNPGGAKLQDVLPADLYARWQVLKLKYIGRDDSVESWRPLFAASELYRAALKKSGLDETGIVGPAIRKAVEAAGIETRSTSLPLKVEDPKKTLKAFNATTLDDVACFRKTLDRLETDLAIMTTRANAWATGDIDALRALPYEDQQEACLSALTGSGFSQKLGIDDVQAQMAEHWYRSVDGALKEQRVVFTILPISQLLKADGVVARLQAKGFEVEAP
ncbi:gumN family protein [Lysobacter antibioticus]|uniref:TraB/GumN family protein n=1 Tax=Lysobacter antibioticus TaxID=84531 RepID=UPI0007214AB3|nr:gumN family protein [Lysobacter antibioticus]